MKTRELWTRIDELATQLHQERGEHIRTRQAKSLAEEKWLVTQHDTSEQLRTIDKQSKEIKRLEMANKKQMQAIDALKKQLADKEIDRDRYAREVALKLAYAVATGDDRIKTLADFNYQFITNTEPPILVNTDDIKIDYPTDLKVTHIDEK